MATQQILSPLPGTFYRKPAPDKPTYKEPGDTVASGDAIGLVEVMKTFYEVKSDVDGRVARFLVGNDEAVQAGQPLVEIEV